MRTFEVRVRPVTASDGRIRAAAQLRSPKREDEIWFELDEAHRDKIAERADPFVLASLLLAMREGIALHVHGAAVSTSLLRNLEEFQQIWHAWWELPMVDLVAEEEREDTRPQGAVVSFSGGVDSAFTTYSHVADGSSHRRDLRAALMIHGMDIPRSDATGFAGAVERSQRMLRSVDLPLITVSTNGWELHGTGTHFPILGITSSLQLVGGCFGAGLVSSTSTYRNLVFPLESTPASDPLLGSSAFEIVHYGAACDRLEKVRSLARWPEAVDHLRGCLQHPSHAGNCGRCHKCLLTYLCFRVLGVKPGCFEPIPSDDIVLEWARRLSVSPVFIADMTAILDEADARGVDEPWVRAARRRLRKTATRRALSMLSPSLSRRAFALYARRPRRR